MGSGQVDLVCFSYLAQVQTHYVDAYPRINYGTEILRTERFLAGDGPIVAGVARSLGLDVILASNAVGDDQAGLDVATRLTGWDVPRASAGPGRTRTNIVVCDAAGNRTWLSDLHGIATELDHVDLKPVLTARCVYIDCYQVLGTAPQRVVEATLDTGAGVVLNLGGSPPPAWLTSPHWPRRVLAIQTNIDEHRGDQAGRLVADLAALNIADLTVITGGRHGAIARSRTEHSYKPRRCRFAFVTPKAPARRSPPRSFTRSSPAASSPTVCAWPVPPAACDAATRPARLCRQRTRSLSLPHA